VLLAARPARKAAKPSISATTRHTP
jgi:hypothetical protein